MAMADSVPGVSGSTIALVMGFYPVFISAVHNFFHSKGQERKDAAKFLVKLGCGWLLGMGSCVLVIKALFTAHAYAMSSLFIGLTLGAIFLLVAQGKEYICDWKHSLLWILLGFLAAVLSASQSWLIGSASVQLDTLSVSGALYLIFSGLIAIWAMLLPGVSGATMLLTLGVYLPVMTGVRAMLYLDFTSVPGLLCLFTGMLLGFLTGPSVIQKAMKYHPGEMVSLILGLLGGSIYAISQGPATLPHSAGPLTWGTTSLVCLFLGSLIPVALEYISHKVVHENKETVVHERKEA
jgi:putative membrane protein